MAKLSLTLQTGKFAVCKFNSEKEIPLKIKEGSFFSITKTKDEISVIGEEHLFSPNNSKIERGFCLLKIDGPLYFSLIGILASVATPLAEAMISIFTLSTYDTDYILIRTQDLEKAINTLEAKGFKINK